MNEENTLVNYSYIDYSQNIQFPYPSLNAGLYSDPNTFHDKPWGNNYVAKSIPNATDFCKNFYAKHHIPTENRPGNNSVNSEFYKYYDDNNYNFKCSTFTNDTNIVVKHYDPNNQYNKYNNYKKY